MDAETSDPVGGHGPRHLIRRLGRERLENAKFGFVTRRVPQGQIESLVVGNFAPRPGDLVLARVERLGHHHRLQLPGGRRSQLFPGDEVVVCYGNRYAPNQFEAEVPADLRGCHLVASGGIAADALSWHSSMRAPTRLRPIGLLGDAENRRLNVADFAIPAPKAAPNPAIPVIVVAGTSMDAGKTTAVAHLIRGGARAALRVGAGKVTGTGAGNDVWLMEDAGAHQVLDFTDLGYASTYKLPLPEVELLLQRMIVSLQQARVDVIIIEIADGLLQRETAALIQSGTFRNLVRGVIFCAGDAMGAGSGVDWLEQRGIPVLAVSGALTAAPLAVQETQQLTGLPVLRRDELATPLVVRELLTVPAGSAAMIGT
jgi:dethiobiotin synthetase